jgi:hypothetical protein
MGREEGAESTIELWGGRGAERSKVEGGCMNGSVHSMC